jgi:hypothetical protein
MSYEEADAGRVWRPGGGGQGGWDMGESAEGEPAGEAAGEVGGAVERKQSLTRRGGDVDDRGHAIVGGQRAACAALCVQLLRGGGGFYLHHQRRCREADHAD